MTSSTADGCCARGAGWSLDVGIFCGWPRRVEAELGEVGGKDGAHAAGVRTDPGEAGAFVAAAGVDALAVAVGSSHAMSSRTATLDFDLITQLRAALPILLVHGSLGVSDEDLRKAVSAGITKINIGTLLNVRFTGVVRAFVASDDRVTDPRRYLTPARIAISEAVAAMIDAIEERETSMPTGGS